MNLVYYIENKFNQIDIDNISANDFDDIPFGFAEWFVTKYKLSANLKDKDNIYTYHNGNLIYCKLYGHEEIYVYENDKIVLYEKGLYKAHWRYNESGNIIMFETSLGYKKLYEYDDNILIVRDSNNNINKLTYDEKGNLLMQEYSNGRKKYTHMMIEIINYLNLLII